MAVEEILTHHRSSLSNDSLRSLAQAYEIFAPINTLNFGDEIDAPNNDAAARVHKAKAIFLLRGATSDVLLTDCHHDEIPYPRSVQSTDDHHASNASLAEAVIEAGREALNMKQPSECLSYASCARLSDVVHGLTADTALPPDPKVDDQHSSATLVTASLQAIIAHGTGYFDYARSYVESRTIHRLERGAWVVRLHKWNSDRVDDLWNRVKRYVDENHCGWSVTCYRITTNVNPGSSEESVTSILIYCFGELVPHMLAVLHVMSGGQIISARPRWLDCQGEVVVQMRCL